MLKISSIARMVVLLASFVCGLSKVANGQNVQTNDPAAGIDLLNRYPTTLTEGDSAPERARVWEFTGADIFRLSHFDIKIGKDLQIAAGEADLGIGHCGDGAVWAVLLPRQSGELTSTATNHPEAIANVWLRFHPDQLDHLFPPETVFADGNTNLRVEILRIANHKLRSSWHMGNRVMIPDTNAMTVDVDTQARVRRFFSVDTTAQTAQYWTDFEQRAVRPPEMATPDATAKAFDQLWSAYDSQYAMFAIRPEVDWAKLREEYRPRAIACKTAPEFADVCAEMLRSLRDLHIWMSLAGEEVPVYNRTRPANSNPAAHEAILGSLNEAGAEVEWAVTGDKIGFIAISGWSDPETPKKCQEVLEKMRDTRGLIVDVRLNGGGSEDLAMALANRFVPKKFIYGYDQFRNGPSHTNLTEKYTRTISPAGPWRYNRPVIVLIGQKCLSSNESFIGMMTGDPDAILMGDHSGGSSGNPRSIDLPFDMIVSLPRWIDYRPDGEPVDIQGFQPQIQFTPEPGAFEGKRDDLLVAALARLKQEPLPHKPIAGAPHLSPIGRLRH